MHKGIRTFTALRKSNELARRPGVHAVSAPASAHASGLEQFRRDHEAFQANVHHTLERSKEIGRPLGTNCSDCGKVATKDRAQAQHPTHTFATQSIMGLYGHCLDCHVKADSQLHDELRERSTGGAKLVGPT